MCNAQPVLKWFIGLSGYLLAFKKRDFWFWSPQKRDPHPLLHPQTSPHLRLCWRGDSTGGVAAPAPCHCRPRAWSTGRGNCHVYWAQPKQSRCRSSHELSAVFCRRCRGGQQHQPSRSARPVSRPLSKRCCPGLVPSHSQFRPADSTLLKVCIPCAASWGKTVETRAFDSSLLLAMRVQNISASLLSFPLLPLQRVGFKSSF